MKMPFIILIVNVTLPILNAVNININGLVMKNRFEKYWNIYEKIKKRTNM